MLPVLITSAVAHGESNALKYMTDHLAITHKSKRLAAAARLYARVMMQGEQLAPQLARRDLFIILTTVTSPCLCVCSVVLAGTDLADAATAAGSDLGLDLPGIVKAGLPDAEVANHEFGGACYISDSLPVVLYLSTK